MFVDMEPEDQLCLMLARGELSPEVRERTLELLASPLRWPLFLAHAKKYDICPIIYQNLETLGFRSVPDPIRAELTKIFGEHDHYRMRLPPGLATDCFCGYRNRGTARAATAAP